MSEQTVASLPQKRTPVFRGSLARTVVISLMIISVVPALIIGATSYIRFRNSIETQTTKQLSAVSQTYSFQVDQLVASNQSAINKIAIADVTNIYLNALVIGSSDSNYYLANETVNNLLKEMISSSTNAGFLQISIVDSQGKVIISSESSVTGRTLTNETNMAGTVLTVDPYILGLLNKDQSVLTYNPGNLYPGKMILITTQHITAGTNATPLTIIGFSDPPILKTLLTNPLSIFSAAHVFYITSDQKIVSLNPVLELPRSVSIKTDQLQTLNNLVANSGYGKNYTYTNFIGTEVYAYIKPIPSFNATYVFEVPVISVLSQLQSLLNFILLLLGGTLLVSGLIAFLGARQIAIPLVDLSNKARHFAGGDFSQKAVVNRRDEIGLLAYSFNYMVDQLATFYQSLEAKVAERTTQLRTASEIAQKAISAPTRIEILQRIVNSIIDQFGFHYASIYLTDASGKNLVLAEDRALSSTELPVRNLRIPLDNTSMIGWVAANNQVRLSQDILTEKPKLLATTQLPSTRSEIAFPITIEDKLVGVLDIQSDLTNTFDIESVPAFTTITNQIATGLRNIELLETTQVSLQETVILYRASREITRAQTEGQVHQNLSDLFNQTAYVSIFLDVEGEEVHLVNLADANSTPADKSMIGTVIPFAKAIAKLSEGAIEIIDNFQLLTDFSNFNPYFGRRGCHSAALIPVFEGQTLKHILAIGSREDSSITALQMQPYSNMAESIGTTLLRIHLTDLLLQKDKDIHTLAAIARMSVDRTNAEDLFKNIHEELKKAFGDGIGFCVAINNIEHGQIQIPYYYDEELLQVEDYSYSNDLLSQVITKEEGILISDATNAGQRSVDSPIVYRSVKSWLGLPMFIGRKVTGVIALFDSNQVGRFKEENSNVLNLVAAQLGLSLFIEKLQKQMKDIERVYEHEQFLLNSLMENIPDRISFKTPNNEFLRVSNSLAQYAGAPSPSDLIGKVDNYRFSAEEDDQNAFPDSEIISTQTPVINKTERWRNPQGDTEWVISSKIPLLANDGSISGLLSISRDVTGLINTEKLAEHRADQLLTASDIARESTAGTMDVNVTLNRLVELIRSRFGFYHASIFLIDPLGKNAVLRESTGEAGAQMKLSAHKLVVGSPSIVGQATGNGIPVVIGDVTKEENYFANPLLPETRSELAIPLKIGEKILGALDVQSRTYDAFSQEDINILQVLADQVAVAIQNADLFTHTQQTLTRHRLLHQVTTANVQNMTVEDTIRNAIETLHQAMPDDKITFLSIDENNIISVRASAGYTNLDVTSRRIKLGQGLIGNVASERQASRIGDAQVNQALQPLSFETNSVLAVPVVFADRLMGVINIESLDIAKFDENDQEFVTTLADNMASIISNIQLLDQVRDQVDRQQKLFDITNKIRRSVDIETIMQTSVTEICNALNIRRASIQITPSLQSENNKEKE